MQGKLLEGVKKKSLFVCLRTVTSNKKYCKNICPMKPFKSNVRTCSKGTHKKCVICLHFQSTMHIHQNHIIPTMWVWSTYLWHVVRILLQLLPSRWEIVDFPCIFDVVFTLNSAMGVSVSVRYEANDLDIIDSWK